MEPRHTCDTLHLEPLAPLESCWICGRRGLRRVHQTRFELSDFSLSDPGLSAYSGQRFWLVRCPGCGFMQPEVLPTLPGFFERLYRTYHNMRLQPGTGERRGSARQSMQRDFDERYRDFLFAGILARLERRVRTGRKLLDIGAHVGRLLFLARERGWEVEGIELNPFTSAFAEEKTGAVIHRVSAGRLASTGAAYHAVTLTDVLEHIPDPLRTLQAARDLLVPGGWVAVKVPCGPSQLLKEYLRSRLRRNYEFTIARSMYHVNHFCPASLRLALERAGFGGTVIEVGAPELHFPRGSRLPDGWSPANAVRLAGYWLARALPGGLHTPLAMNLVAFAKRPL